jgi:hypothetical protein
MCFLLSTQYRFCDLDLCNARAYNSARVAIPVSADFPCEVEKIHFT